ncbi:MAG: hypothetical protein QOG25_1793 [Acetobacteraceae bacterium]|nr:hypothetical protein [Acetobacteraceae bacterium]
MAGLNLITARIVHCNTVCLDWAVQRLRAQGAMDPDDLLAYAVPLGWEHVGPTGDCVCTETDPCAPLQPPCEIRTTFLLQRLGIRF